MSANIFLFVLLCIIYHTLLRKHVLFAYCIENIIAFLQAKIGIQSKIHLYSTGKQYHL